MFGAQNQNIGLYTDFLQHFHRMLGWLCLQLFCRADIRHISQVYAQCVTAHFPSELAHGLKIGCRLYVAHGSAYLGYYIVKVAGIAEQLHITLYLVGYMGYYLYRLAQIVATAFLVYNTLVYTAGSDVICPRGLHVGKPFVMPQVEIGLMAVYRNVTFPVLIRVKSAGVNVQVRVELLYGHTVAASLEQARQR